MFSATPFPCVPLKNITQYTRHLITRIRTISMSRDGLESVSESETNIAMTEI